MNLKMMSLVTAKRPARATDKPKPILQVATLTTKNEKETRSPSIEHISSPVLERKIVSIGRLASSRRSRSADETTPPPPTDEAVKRGGRGEIIPRRAPMEASVLSDGDMSPRRTHRVSPVRRARFEESPSRARGSILRSSPSASPRPLTFKARQALTRIDMIKVQFGLFYVPNIF